MTHALGRAVAALALALLTTGGPVALGDDKKEPAPKAPDWSNYTFVADVTGEVVRADDKKVVLRVTWYEAPQPKGGNNNNRRPNLGGNNRNFRNPFAQNMNRPNQQKGQQLKEKHEDYELEYVEQSLVRTKALPPKIDDKGKKVAYTQKELEEFRAPLGVPAYAASRSDVTPATYLEVYLVREKAIPAAKATEDDLRIKYAFILGKDPNPPKDIGGPEKKKKN